MKRRTRRRFVGVRPWKPNRAPGKFQIDLRPFADREVIDAPDAQAAFAERLRRMEALRESAAPLAPEVRTYSDATENFVAKRLPQLAAGTQRNWMYTLRSLEDAFGALPLREADRWYAKIRGYKEKAAETLVASSLNHHLTVLSAVLHWCAHPERKYWRGPLPTIEKLPEDDAAEKEPLSEPQLKGLLSFALDYDPELYPLVVFVAVTGTRKSEPLGVELADLDLDAGTVRIRGNASRRLKTRRSRRTVPLEPWVLDLLRPLVDTFDEETDEAPGFLFRNREGRRWRFWPQRRWDALVEAARLPQATPHLMRHTFISLHAQKGTPLWKIAKWVGHSTTWITERYAHLQPDHQRDMLGKLDIAPTPLRLVPPPAATGTE